MMDASFCCIGIPYLFKRINSLNGVLKGTIKLTENSQGRFIGLTKDKVFDDCCR